MDRLGLLEREGRRVRYLTAGTGTFVGIDDGRADGRALGFGAVLESEPGVGGVTGLALGSGVGGVTGSALGSGVGGVTGWFEGGS